MHQLISRKTLNEFREWMVGWILRQIDDEFSAAGITLAPTTRVIVSGERRNRIELYYASLDLTKPADAGKLIVVFENVILTATQAQPQTAHKLITWTEKDGYSYEGGRLRRRSPTAMRNTAERVAAAISGSIHTEIRRIEESVDSDPALAIGSAKELVESVCKTILDAKGVSYSKNADLSELVKAATKAVKLAPDDIPSAAKGADLIKRTLHSLAGITGNIGELRSLYGTGHGKNAKTKGLRPRHARLVAGCVSTLVTFLWDTFEERDAKTP
jgi:hypothetical protein